MEPNTKSKIKQVLIENLIVVFMIIAVIVGLGLGFGLRGVWEPTEKRKIFYLEFPGQLLLNMLNMLILPLIVSSIVTALAAMDSRASGRLGLGAVIYYLSTTLIAVILGIILVVSIRPGFAADDLDRTGSSRESSPLNSLLDLIRNCFPSNLIEACFQQSHTVYSTTIINTSKVVSQGSENVIVYEAIPTENIKIVTKSGMNVLGLVVFSIFLGCAINHVGEMAKPLRNLFEALNEVVMCLVGLVIWFSPIGIMFLIAAKFVGMESPEKTFTQLGLYFATVITGLFIHGAIILPLIYFIATRKNPFIFLYRMLKAILTAWGTASSSATLPVTMDCLINRNRVNPLVARFVAPIGATINMDGTALYEAMAAIFVAQTNGITLGIADVIIVSITATAAAIGAAGIPQAGLVTMLSVLTAVGLPTKDLALLLTIDWIVDRFRTAVNIIGDSFGAGILSHLLRNSFHKLSDLDLELDCDDKQLDTNDTSKQANKE